MSIFYSGTRVRGAVERQSIEERPAAAVVQGLSIAGKLQHRPAGLEKGRHGVLQAGDVQQPGGPRRLAPEELHRLLMAVSARRFRRTGPEGTRDNGHCTERGLLKLFLLLTRGSIGRPTDRRSIGVRRPVFRERTVISTILQIIAFKLYALVCVEYYY